VLEEGRVEATALRGEPGAGRDLPAKYRRQITGKMLHLGGLGGERFLLFTRAGRLHMHDKHVDVDVSPHCDLQLGEQPDDMHC
jgi:hypothetical protein